jgi:hypothetical protein
MGVKVRNNEERQRMLMKVVRKTLREFKTRFLYIASSWKKYCG